MSSDNASTRRRDVLFGLLEAAWGLGVRGAGIALGGRHAGTVSTEVWPGRTRVLVIAPHPDDETIGAGGAIAMHVRAGDPVTILVVTDGGASRAAGLEEAEMRRRRAAEVRRAAAVLGVGELLCLDLPEGRWREEELRGPLRRALGEADLVYAPSSVDFHPEHVRVARTLADLLADTASAPAAVRVYELGVPLTPLLVNRVIDVGAVAGLKERALAEFRSQAGSVSAVRRLARYQARFYGTPVEVFWEMPATTYARVMREVAGNGDRALYRGVRPRPLSDPLAAIVGLRARARLRTGAGAMNGDA